MSCLSARGAEVRGGREHSLAEGNGGERPALTLLPPRRGRSDLPAGAEAGAGAVLADREEPETVRGAADDVVAPFVTLLEPLLAGGTAAQSREAVTESLLVVHRRSRELRAASASSSYTPPRGEGVREWHP